MRLSDLLWMAAIFVTSLPVEAVPDWAKLDALATKAMADSGTPGASIAVVKNDRIVYSRSFGVASIEGPALITGDTLFRIGSTTKMFTAAALLSLVEERKVQLDKPVSTYIPGLDPKLGAVTVNQLLSHTAGLGDRGSGHGKHDDSALAEGIRALKGDIVELEPGTVYSYSSLGYWIAGLITETVGGKPFADTVAERVFQPLGMQRTTFRPLVAMTYPFAQQHDVSPEKAPRLLRPFADDAATWPGGSLFSTSNDLARFMIAFLNQGRIDNKAVLAPGIIKAMSEPHAAIPGGDGHYTYGLVLDTDRGIRTLAHGGARVGFGSLLVMAPDERAGVVVVTNRSGSTLGSVVQEAMEMVVKFGPEPPPPTAPAAPSQAQLAGYAGVYAGGTLRVTIRVEAQRLVAHYDGKDYPARPSGEHAFSTEGPLGRLVFVPGASGGSRYLHVGLRSLRKVE